VVPGRQFVPRLPETRLVRVARPVPRRIAPQQLGGRLRPDRAGLDLHEPTGQWYLHLFESAQPDLNWDEPAVVEAMHDTLRFWLDRGVDGFRADVVHGIGKDPALPDDPPDVAGVPHCALNDQPVTHERLRAIRTLVDSYPDDRMMVGEVFLLSTEAVATYYGHDDELHLAFNFPPLFAPWLADRWRACIEDTLGALGPRGAWPTWVLSNHDNPRHRTRYDRAAAHAGEDAATNARRSEARARAAAVLLLTLRGTPFVYQGEELGLADADIGDDRRVDPGGRDGCRAPVPWDAGADHGWPTRPGSATWLPMAPEADVRNRASEAADPSSVLQLYRRAIAVRRATPALTRGAFALLDVPDGVLGYRREVDGDAVEVLVNFTGASVGLGDPGVVGAELVLASDHTGPSDGFTGVLGPDQAVVIRR